MSYRYMRVFCFFDLPVDTADERRAYRQFRKYLIKNGFLMLQESIYCKLVPNAFSANSVIADIKKHSPAKGSIQAMKVTEKEYMRMESIIGNKQTEVLESDEKLVIL